MVVATEQDVAARLLGQTTAAPQFRGVSTVRRWRHLRTYRIARALPEQRHVALADGRAAVVRVRPGVYACGDHLDTASINGALRAGRLAAEAVIEDLARVRTRRAAAVA